MAAGCQDYTEDSLFNGRLICRQPRQGYRFSLDAVLLARFITPRPGDRILDLGAGCGVISLILAYLWPKVRMTALELQPALAELCQRNGELNRYQERLTTITGDLGRIKEHVDPGSFAWVVANPPYRKADSGRVNPGAEQARARHELDTDLDSVVKAAVFAVKNRGRVAFVFPARRGAALIHAMQERNLAPKRLQIVYSYPGDEARLFLVESIANGGEGLTILPPFYVYDQPGGDYSPEMAQCYAG